MYGLAMYHTVKTLLEQGHSQRSIARQLNLHRKTVKEIVARLAADNGPPSYQRASKLDAHAESIRNWLSEDGLSRRLIHERLGERHGVRISYSALCSYVRQLIAASAESFVPQHAAPGEEAQVDFGYLGRFRGEAGNSVKVWCFSMGLSHSRYSYHEVVRDQSVATFIRCHRNAFEYFGGVPQQVKLDNLKAGVIKPDFYEPLLQEQYAAFLAHYGCAGVPCRVRKPEHKGKVESLVKYVKGNFVKRLSEEQHCWTGLQQRLQRWTDEICNPRRHGTTHRVTAEVFAQVERPALQPLPAQRYEFLRWEARKVNRFGHLTFDSNYYSVPYQYQGQVLRLQTNGRILHVYAGSEVVAVHACATGRGQYVTRPEHLPEHKRLRNLEQLRTRMGHIGPEAAAWMEACVDAHPKHWRDKIRGVLSLRRWHAPATIERACGRALEYGLLTYRSVRRICEHAERPPASAAPGGELINQPNGYHHDLSTYDQL